MADIPLEGNLDNIDNLNEALNLSRALVDNARELHKLHKDAGFELYKSFKESSIDLSKTLNVLLSNYSKFENFEVKKSQALKLQERLEKDINLLLANREKINDGTIDTLVKEKDLAKQQLDKVNSRLAKHTELGNTIRAKLIEERKLAEEVYNTKLSQLRTEQDALETSDEAIKMSRTQLDYMKMYVKNIDSASAKMGFLGRILKGFARIPILGDIINAEKTLKVMNQSALKGENLGTNIAKGGSAMFEGLLSKMNVAIIGFTTLGIAIKFIIDSMFQASKNVAELARGVDVSKDRARELRQEFFAVSSQSRELGVILGENLISAQQIHETFLGINSNLGTAVDFSKEFVAQMAVAREYMGLSEDSQKGLLFLSKANFSSQRNILNTIITTNEYLKSQGKSIMSNKAALEGVLKVSGYLRTIFKGNVEELTKSITQAQLMGVTLDRVNNVAESFLDFESSISNELNAQLLTGRDINLDAARYYSLTNNTLGLMGEMRKNFPSFEEFNNLNRIAAEGIAQAFGMTRDEMANAVFEQETLYKLTQSVNGVFKNQLTDQQRARLGGIKDLQTAFNLVKEGGISMSQIRDVVGEIAYSQLLATDAQTKFNQALERAKESFSRIVEGKGLDKLADAMLGLAEALSHGIGGLFDIDKYVAKAKTEREIQDIKIEAEKNPELAKAIEENVASKKDKNLTTSASPDAAWALVSPLIPLLSKSLGYKRAMSEEEKVQALTMEAYKKYQTPSVNVYMDGYKTGTSMQQAVTNIQ